MGLCGGHCVIWARLVQYAAPAVVGMDSSLLLRIPDHLMALGTLPAPAGPIHPTFPEFIAQCIIKSLPVGVDRGVGHTNGWPCIYHVRLSKSVNYLGSWVNCTCRIKLNLIWQTGWQTDGSKANKRVIVGDIYNWVKSQKSKFQVWRSPRLFSSLIQSIWWKN